MAYQMAATIVTLNDLERYLSVADVFKCNPSNICAAFYTISTDSVLARFLCISRASCQFTLENVRVCYFLNCMGQAVPSFRPSMGKTPFAKLQPRCQRFITGGYAPMSPLWLRPWLQRIFLHWVSCKLSTVTT